MVSEAEIRLPGTHRLAPHADPRSVFLAADVGGTHARVGLVRAGIAQTDNAASTPVEVLQHQKYRCVEFSGLPAILTRFLETHAVGMSERTVQQAVIACAGLVEGDRITHANLAWPLQLAPVRAVLGTARLEFINDFEAAAHAAQCLDPQATRLLHAGAPATRPGPKLVLGPGTGLGAAYRIPGNGTVRVLPSEAGHACVAPANEREWQVCRWLAHEAEQLATPGAGAGTGPVVNEQRVVNEQMISGPGLVNVYRALAGLEGASVPDPLRPDIIAQAARSGDARALEAVHMMLSLLGGLIGDLCLIGGATRVYIAGGVLPKLLEFLPGSDFTSRMHNKGPLLRSALERIPVHLVEDDCLGVIGAAAWLLQQEPAIRAQHPAGAQAQ